MHQRIKTVLLFIIVPLFACAQNIVTGTVIDASNGLPIPSADVLIKGTSNIITTDFDGIYTLNNIPNGSIIKFSYIGYITQEIVYTNQITIDISLEEQPSELETITAIAYGSIKQKNISNSQETIQDKDFNKGAITSPGQLIAGKAAGLFITAASGRPSDSPVINIRPGFTLSGNQNPLYVVDGIPLDQNNARLNSINPNDIENFTILKDASATAIYGSRASNGVILITTKKADFNSDLKITYNLKFAIEKVDNYIDVLTGNEFRQLIVDQGRDTSILGNENTDWQDAIYQNGTRTIHNLTVEKGYKSTAIRAALGYNNEQGTLQRSGYERANLGLNVIQKLLNDRLKLTFTSQLTKEEIRSADLSAIAAAVIFDPTQPIKSNDNNFNGFFEYTNSTGVELNAPRNPLGLLNSLDAQLDNNQARLNINIDYKLPIENLKFIGNAGVDYNEFDYFSLRDINSSTGLIVPSQNHGHGIRRNNLIDARLNYKKDIAKYNTQVELTAGSSFQKFFRQSFNSGLENGILTDFPSSIDDHSITTFFSRAQFNILNRFLLSGSYSRNGSSRFSKENKWANFYGVSGAVKLTDTEFIKNSTILSQLKFKGGYGETGQQEINTPITFLSALTLRQQNVASQFLLMGSIEKRLIFYYFNYFL